ncbi:MAG: FG-GAP-like repeat-containing protein, partial [Chloroflexota bacterium]
MVGLSLLLSACTSTPETVPTATLEVVPTATVAQSQPATPTSTPLPPQPSPTAKVSEAQPNQTLQDVAGDIGLTFTHGAFQTSLAKDPIGMMGGGLCWLDVENDGWLDLYVVNSHALHEESYWEDQGGLPRNALFHNQGDGTFADISQASQTDLALRGNGCVAVDLNLDGWTDLYITADGPNALLWNNGDGTFSEGAAAAGLDTPEWNSATAVGDINQDGWPDLFVAAYIDLTRQIPKPSGSFPQDFYGLPDHLFLSNGRQSGSDLVTFRDVTLPAGLVKEERGLGALFSDVDQDGDLDLYIANDGNPNRLYINELHTNGTEDPDNLGFQLTDMTVPADVGDSGSGMGIAGGDYDNDGLVDLFVTNWQIELNALYRNETDQANNPAFQYSTYRIGISGLGNNKTGWGTAWLDLDHDTDLDLLIANGRVPMTDMETDAQLVRLYRNRTWQPTGASDRPGQFIEWTQQVGLTDVGPLMARGSAAADYDNDGDLDIAINTIANPLVLLENSGATGNWLQVQSDGFYPGLMVKATLPDGRQLVRELYAGSSYLASEDPRLHMGLGQAEVVSELMVLCPNGSQLTLIDVPANQLIH